MPQPRRRGNASRAWKTFVVAGALVAVPFSVAAQNKPRPFPTPTQRQDRPLEEQPQEKSAPVDLFPLSVLWTVKLAGPPALDPVFDGDRVFVALKPVVEDGVQTQPPLLVAHSVSSGVKLWQRELPGAAAVAAGSGLVYSCSGPLLRAFDEADGTPKWEVLLDAPPAAPLLHENGWLIAATQGSQAFAISSRDGRKAWQAPLPSPATGEPRLTGNRVYLPLTNDRVICLDLADGAVAWNQKVLAQPRTILALPDRIFVGTAERWFYALDPGDGRVLWRTRVGSAIVGTPICDRTTVYFLALDNLLRALSRDSGDLRWRQMLVRRARFGPFTAGPVLFVSGLSTSIHAYGAGQGKPAGSFDAPKDLFAPVHVIPGLLDDDFLVVALTGEGDLMAIRPKSLEPEPFALSPMLALIAGFPVWIY